jgi:hypothetical protein
LVFDPVPFLQMPAVKCLTEDVQMLLCVVCKLFSKRTTEQVCDFSEFELSLNWAPATTELALVLKTVFRTEPEHTEGSFQKQNTEPEQPALKQF